MPQCSTPGPTPVDGRAKAPTSRSHRRIRGDTARPPSTTAPTAILPQGQGPQRGSTSAVPEPRPSRTRAHPPQKAKPLSGEIAQRNRGPLPTANPVNGPSAHSLGFSHRAELHSWRMTRCRDVFSRSDPVIRCTLGPCGADAATGRTPLGDTEQPAGCPAPPSRMQTSVSHTH